VRPLARAPRLRRLTLEAIDGSKRSLFAELRARQEPLVFFVEGRTPHMMRWPGEPRAFLPVFGDLRSLDRMARETGMQARNVGVAAMRPSELLAWAHKDGLPVVLGVFPDQGAVQYLKIDPGEVLA
jgi:hypothetical protein